MPRYFLHLRYSALEDGFAHDDEGDELSDPVRSGSMSWTPPVT